ncbi:glycerol kinase GlpK [Parahaliea mediterranea]|uniref:glycerol kinase n=1 Tax=Parahaliea mediterranea TaxID=651086 RepID=A0A939DH50_9GAMM|nr:glycerol kinase GlpK [Parahaliea mediterranea]MBN7798139.1 glycerol kinase GlpK [Parahaliea mediterranea]
MGDFILAIDQGTTGSTVALMDAGGRLRASVNHEFTQHYPQPGWVEHRPADIWASVRKGIRAVLRKRLCRPSDIAAIGITNQRETAMLWDRDSGEALNNAVVWQCRRTTDFCEALKSAGHEKMVRRKSGLLLDPYFSASKFRWLLRNTRGVGRKLKAGKVLGGTVDSYLVWQLSGGGAHVSDVSNASRTSLMNLGSLGWDSELLELFEVPADILPRIVPSSGVLAHTRGVKGLPDGIPIAGIAGDQQAALFGQACFTPGDAKCTFGTGSFIVMNTGGELLYSRSNLLTTLAWQLGETGKPVYALEGGAFVCGAAVQWLRDGLQIIKRAGEVETLARQVEDHGGVEFVPALTGLGAPHWAPEARGMLCGLTRGSGRGHIARATLDAMALQNADILMAMERDLGKRMKPLRVDGGAAANDLLMQIQADVLGRKLIRPRVIETTVAGASYLAGLGVGLWSGVGEIRKIWEAEQEFRVKMTPHRRRQRFASWQKALERTLL